MLFTSSVSYMQEKAAFAIRERHLSPTSLNQLIGPLSSVVWIFILITFCISIAIILLTKFLPHHYRNFIIGGRNHRTPILNMFNLFLGGSMSNPRLRRRQYFGTFARTLTMHWILFSFFLRLTYEGALFTFFKEQRFYSKCDTFEKIKTSDCKIIATHSGVDTLSMLNIGKTR